ncbi:MAG: alcohol dehydrogenase catalytic domain-containing protein [Chloroflexota bacterium]|nr:alcohol dehydrogenase catalytic domain-containing protein [Chloroflexota bacterium]MDE2961258.1 alcohol dehydrogenase catalytic domain-containing protein [Chloroflexota bacterium]
MTLSSLPDTMSALTLVQAGNPPTLAIAERKVPTPEPGEVLLRVDACGFCHHDYLVLTGTLRRGVAPGVILGHEIAGTVVASGDGVTAFGEGDRVVSLLTAACGECARCRIGREHRCRHGAGIGHGRDGGFAEYVALPETALVAAPDSVPPERAALLACPAGVALSALDSAEVAAGETVVVTGAGGGLGSHAVQLAAAGGVQVIAVTSSPGKAAGLEKLGASIVIDVADGPDLAEIVLAVTDDAGADAVIDTVGPPLWPDVLQCLGQYGRLALLGDVTGEPATVRLAEVIFRDLRLTGVSGVSRRTLERCVEMAAAGQLEPVVAEALPLTEQGVREAVRMVREREPLGRVVLVP